MGRVKKGTTLRYQMAEPRMALDLLHGYTTIDSVKNYGGGVQWNGDLFVNAVLTSAVQGMSMEWEEALLATPADAETENGQSEPETGGQEETSDTNGQKETSGADAEKHLAQMAGMLTWRMRNNKAVRRKLMNTEKKHSEYEELMQYLEEAQAYETALILFEWDEETLAPEGGGKPHRPDTGVCCPHLTSAL